MEEKINLKISEMAESLIGVEIITLANAIKERINKGEKILNLTMGDFDPKIFPIPDELKNEIIAAYNSRQTNYPTANGIVELREAVSSFLYKRGGLEYDRDQILITGGGRPIVYGTYQIVLDPGDTVIFPVPSWNNKHYCHIASAKQIKVETKPENNFMPTAEELHPYISEANLLALCSPQNPTGTVFSKNALEAICDLVIQENKRRDKYKKPLYVLYDQIYWMQTYGETRHYDPVTLCPEMKDYTLFMDGISKAFCATGVRVGWGFGPQKLIDKMRAISTHMGAWAPRAEQVAVANYLLQESNINTYLAKCNSRLKKRLDAFYDGFLTLKSEGYKVDAIAPQAAIYLTVKIDLCGFITNDGFKLETTKDVTNYILDSAKIALVPFYAFGADKNSNWYRLSVGTTSMEDIEIFFKNLRDALSKLS
ncbi:MAG: pyridoxal phosphate-dependent aminotransferase [Bacteroidota bacterium]